MVRLTIYKKGTSIDSVTQDDVRWVANEWQFTDTLMDSQSITLNAKSEKVIEWKVGDFCVYRGVTYTLNLKPSVTQNARENTYGEAFEYNDLKFESALADLKRCTILDITPTTGDYKEAHGENHTGNAIFQLQCCETKLHNGTVLFTAVEYLLGIIKANLDRLFPTAGWQVRCDNAHTHTDDTLISFSNTNALDALKMVHETFRLYYCVIGRTIYVGFNFSNLTSENEDGMFNALENPTWDEEGKLMIGYGKGDPSRDGDVNTNEGTGLYKIEQKTSGDGNITTRLRAYGSKRNLPYRWYNTKYESIKVGGFFVTNLQLPNAFDNVEDKEAGNIRRGDDYAHVLGTATDCYIDKDNNAENCEEGVWEGVGVWDGSDKDHEEIYPTIEDMTYKELRDGVVPDYKGTVGDNAFPNYQDAEKVNEIEAVDSLANYGDGIIIPFEQGVDQTGTTVALSCSGSGKANNGNFADVTFEVGRIIDTQVAADYTFSREEGVALKISADTTQNHDTNYWAKMHLWHLKFFVADEDGTELCSTECTSNDFKWVGTEDGHDDGYYYCDIPMLPYVQDGVNRKLTLASDTKVVFKICVSSEEGGFNVNTNPAFKFELYNRVEGKVQGVWRNANVNTTYASTPFTMYVRDFGLNFANLIDTGDTPVISMKTGSCVACDFKLSGTSTPTYINDNGRLVWKLVMERCFDESIGAYYPSEQYPLNAGDKFVVLNCELPDFYIKAAEIRLLAAATKYLKKVQEQNYTYTPALNDIFLQNDYEKKGTHSIYWNLYAGVMFPLLGIPKTAGGDLPENNVLIKSVSIKEGGYTPEVELTLDNEIEETIQQRLNNTISRLTSDNSSAVTSEINALIKMINNGEVGITAESLKDEYISKKKDDTAYGVITFKNGVSILGDAVTHDIKPAKNETYSIGTSGNKFVNGYFSGNVTAKNVTASGNGTFSGNLKASGDGSVGGKMTFGTFNKGIQGGQVDENADAELNSLTLRESLTVPKLVYNRTEAVGGNTWRCAGGGEISSVSARGDGTGTATLKLESGEIGMIAVGDICQGIFHLSNNNETTNEDKRNGNFKFAGFKTIYFEILSVSGSNNNTFTYKIRSASDASWTDSTHPQPHMNFAAYGNVGNTEEGKARQSSELQTRDYTLLLSNVSSWNYSEQNMMLIMGKLDGFTIKTESKPDGMELQGSGIAFGNAYWWGSMTQIDRLIESFQIQLSNNVVQVAMSDWYTEDDKDDIEFDFTAKVVTSKGEVVVPTGIELTAPKGLNLTWSVTSFENNTYTIHCKVTGYIAQEVQGVSAKDNAISIRVNVSGATLYNSISLIESYEGKAGDDGQDGEAGASLDAEYSDDQESWHSAFVEGDVWMHTKMSNESEWGDPIRIVGEKGGETDYSYAISADKETTSATTAPTISGEWNDSPVAVTDDYPFAWMKIQAKTGDGEDSGEAKYVRLTGEKGKNGVVYELVPGTLVLSEGDTFTNLYLYKTDGDVRSLMSYADASSESIVVEKDTEASNDCVVNWNSAQRRLYVADGVVYGNNYTVVAKKNNVEIARLTIGVVKKGERGKHGTSFSIRKWEDVKVGDTFLVENEVNGTVISDIVIDEDSNKWLCKKDFTIDGTIITLASAKPKADSEYWTQFNQFKNVATDLLLAEKALIKNLITESLLCESSVPDEETGLTFISTLSVGADADTTLYPKLIFNVDAKDEEGNITSEYGYNTFGIDGCFFMTSNGKYRSEVTPSHVKVEYKRGSNGSYTTAGVYIQGTTEYEDAETHETRTTAPSIALKNISGYTATLTPEKLELDGNSEITAKTINSSVNWTFDADMGYVKGLTGSILMNGKYLNILNGLIVSVTIEAEFDVITTQSATYKDNTDD